MVKSLRKKHLQVWSMMALLLPAGIIAAVAVRPSPKQRMESSISAPIMIKEMAIKPGIAMKSMGRERFVWHKENIVFILNTKHLSRDPGLQKSSTINQYNH